LAAYLAGRGHGTQDGAHDFGGQAGGFGLQLGHGFLFVLFHGGTGLLDLLLGTGTGFIHEMGASLIGLLAAGFLIFENFLTRFAETLFVFGGAGLGGGDVGAGFFHCALGTLAAFGKDGGEGTMDEEQIKDIQERQKEDGGKASEQ
jgi:hypothetical protein